MQRLITDGLILAFLGLIYLTLFSAYIDGRLIEMNKLAYDIFWFTLSGFIIGTWIAFKMTF